MPINRGYKIDTSLTSGQASRCKIRPCRSSSGSGGSRGRRSSDASASAGRPAERACAPASIGRKSSWRAMNSAIRSSFSALQDRAGDVDDAPAALDETHRAFKRFVLILDALLERAGADAPLGVGIAPPGAGAGAGRVDQHEIAAPLEVGEHVRRPLAAPGPGRCARPTGRAGRRSARAGRASGSAA